MNDYQLLGNITEQSLGEIWRGEKAQELRRAMEGHDLSLGCEICQWQVDEGHRELAFSRWFECFAETESEPPWPQQLELAMSNTCNLQCVMCNAEWSSSIRTQRDGLPPLPDVYDDRFFHELRDFLPHLTSVKFLGGEPFLASETLRVMDMLVEGGYTPRVHVTTNGTQWTPRVEKIMAQMPVEVAVSLDAASPQLYEQIRVGSSWDTVQANLDTFQERAADVSVTYCLMTNNWQDFGAFCQQADARDIGCAVNVVTEPAHLSLYKLPPNELAEIMAELNRQDRRIRAGLGRSLATWDGEVSKLRRHLEVAREGKGVLGIHNRRLNEEFPRPFPRVAESGEEAVRLRAEIDRLTEAHLGSETTALLLDDAGRVTSAEGSAERLGIDASDLEGRHLDDLLDVFSAAFGDLEAMESIEVVDGISVYGVLFTRGVRLVVLHAPTMSVIEGLRGMTLTIARSVDAP